MSSNLYSISLKEKLASNTLFVDQFCIVDKFICSLSPVKMQELGMSSGEVVTLEGKNSLISVSTLWPTEACPLESIRISKQMKQNLGVRQGDTVRIYKTVNIEVGSAISISPLEDAIEGSTYDILEIFIKPHFAGYSHPIKKGDIFSITAGQEMVEFKVIDCKPNSVCLVGPDTTIYYEAVPVKPEEPFLNTDVIEIKDIALADDIKDGLLKLFKLPFENPRMHLNVGMRLSRGYLFFGPAGCGKTVLAKAIAYECGFTFIHIKGFELIALAENNSEIRIRDVLNKARAAAPTVILFDDLDLIASSNGAYSLQRVLYELIDEMENFEIDKNVVFIGATNRPDIIDPAIIRPGRLETFVYIPPPDEANRYQLFQLNLRKTSLAPDVDLRLLAKYSSGLSGAEIAYYCQQACRLAIQQKLDDLRGNEAANDQKWILTRDHLKEAVRTLRSTISLYDLAKYDIFAQTHEQRNFSNTMLSQLQDPSERNDGNLYD